MRINLLILVFILMSCGILNSQSLIVNAGTDKKICPNKPTQIGGNPTILGGTQPFTVLWTPSIGLNSINDPNPITSIESPITYTLYVKDALGNSSKDSISLTVDDIVKMNAGEDLEVCKNAVHPAILGNQQNYKNPYTFLWLPASSLMDSLAPRPNALPKTTTVYTLQISSPICGTKTDEVLVVVRDMQINAGNDTIMKEGETITLHAVPNDTNLIYSWMSSSGAVNYRTTYNPDVSPTKTAIVKLTVTDRLGCKFFDDLTVEVIPSEELVFYTSFTPNNDGDNDVWAIGNIEKFPDNRLQIFNRYGQEVYSAVNYKNNWDGKYLGNDLPGGTYYFIFNTFKNDNISKGYLTLFR